MHVCFGDILGLELGLELSFLPAVDRSHRVETSFLGGFATCGFSLNPLCRQQYLRIFLRRNFTIRLFVTALPLLPFEDSCYSCKPGLSRGSWLPTHKMESFFHKPLENAQLK
jgi:hypothetical protein